MSGEITEFRHNVMKINSVESFANIRGGVYNNRKDVYFVRAVGVCAGLREDIIKMDNILSERASKTGMFYKRLSGADSFSPEETKEYTRRYDDSVNRGGKEFCIKFTEGSQYLQRLLGSAIGETLRIFHMGRQPNPSIDRNFVVKLLIKLDMLTTDIGKYDVARTVKIAAQNIVKKQDYLFFYMLTLLGFDVLLIQSEGDIGEAEKALGLSESFELGGFGKCEIPEYSVHKAVTGCSVVNPAVQNTVSQPAARPVVVIPPRNRSGRRPSDGMNTASSANAAQNAVNGLPCSGGSPLPDMGNSRTASPGFRHTASAVNSVPAGVHISAASAQAVRREKSFEELAALASSVVMITVFDITGRAVSSGSGIMIGKNGYILTNNHVASGGRFYAVRIEDDDNLYKTDEVIKYNPLLDLAVIRIGRTLDPIPVYKGKELVRGQKVVAIGSPLGLFNSVSDGIISGFRKINDVDMIQFTAPISHGSSGGAVLNMYGEVIGISTAGIDEGQNLNLAMGYECINGFIRGFV